MPCRKRCEREGPGMKAGIEPRATRCADDDGLAAGAPSLPEAWWACHGRRNQRGSAATAAMAICQNVNTRAILTKSDYIK